MLANELLWILNLVLRVINYRAYCVGLLPRNTIVKYVPIRLYGHTYQ